MHTRSLPTGYSFREMSAEEFRPLWLTHAKAIFDKDAQVFRVMEHLSKAEKTRVSELGKDMGKPWQLRIGVFHDGDFVGWHTGNQESAETFYMRNSAVLPEHRGKGIYWALLAEILRRVSERGFQKIYSRRDPPRRGDPPRPESPLNPLLARLLKEFKA